MTALTTQHVNIIAACHSILEFSAELCVATFWTFPQCPKSVSGAERAKNLPQLNLDSSRLPTRQHLLSLWFVLVLPSVTLAESPVEIKLLFTLVDLKSDEAADVTLSSGQTVRVKLLEVKERRDRLRGAVREATAVVEVDGQKISVPSSTYNLPKTIGSVQIDCPVTKGYGGSGIWAMDADARLRLWPAGSPWIRPGTFLYPAKQMWFATDTQMGNVPCCVNGCDVPGKTSVYYHYHRSPQSGCSKSRTLGRRADGEILPNLRYHKRRLRQWCLDRSPNARPFGRI